MLGADLWAGFFVAVVNREDLKQTEMGRSMQMIIDQTDFAKYCSIFQMCSLHISSQQKSEKNQCTAGKSEQKCR